MITRENYEEFFLLYVDNELSFADRTLVEQFVAENPDLEEEWEALLQCRILPDRDERTVFGHKESLMRFGGEAVDAGAINDDNYEEYFLSYIDGELGANDRQSVEAFVRRYPSKGAELERIQQTLSQPDPAILFPDKESLYKKEARRLVISPWWRVAAAAVLLGVIGWFAVDRFASGTHGNKAVPALAGAAPKKEAVKKDPSPVTPATPDTFYSSGSSTVPTAADLVKKENSDEGPTQKWATQITPLQKIVAPEEKTTALVAIAADPGKIADSGKIADPGKIAYPGKIADPATIADPGTNVDPAKATALANRMVPPVDRAVGPEEGTISRENSSFATQALLNNATASRDDNEDDGDEPALTKKNKLRGIFRKVSRAFEKTADRDDNGQRKVLIGAFQVALK
jgi:hypothetical protein